MNALKHIREARGLTQKQLAERLHTTDVSISRYESEDQRLTLPLLRRLARELKCSIEEIAGDAADSLILSDPSPFESLRERDRSVPEVDIRAGMGGGGINFEELNVTDAEGNTIAADAITGRWWLPDDYLARELKVSAKTAWIVEVQGDSMAPTLLSGDRVMVDTAQKRPSPPGIFALWDGIGIVVKRLDFIPGSDPATVEIISDNALHKRYDRTVEEAHIIGRVVWYARKL